MGDTLVVYTDGATRPVNPGPSGYGAALYAQDESGNLTPALTDRGYMGEDFSNNQAEYAGMLAGLRLAKASVNWRTRRVVVRSDSSLVINQVLGKWVLRAAKLGPLHAAVRESLQMFKDINVDVQLEHVRGHRGEEGNEAADRLASSAIADKSPVPECIAALLAQAQGKSLVSKKGHEKLVDLVKGYFGSKRHPSQVIDMPAGLGSGGRATLNKLGSDATSQLLLQFPQLALIGPTTTILVALTTGFKRLPGKPAVRTMDMAAFDTAKRLAAGGYNVLVVHKPHARGKWMTFAEMGWDKTGSGEVDMVFAPITDLDEGAMFSQDGWPPFVGLVNIKPWSRAV